MNTILTSLGTDLYAIEKPARYLGGEFNSTRKDAYSLHVMLCFPDLYEIGMSNNAMRILYSGLNACDGVFCERVFSPAADFSALLQSKNIPLYGLESKDPVKGADILAFTVGYELAATNILEVLALSGITLEAIERTEDQPIVIAGGPGITNPVPYSKFLDAVWIGEAEDEFFTLCQRLASMKEKGASRKALLSVLTDHPSFWIPGKITARNIDESFSSRSISQSFPNPVIRPVQDHGVVEIMRGCPNGCRFCQAGFLYRPCRYKKAINILKEVEDRIGEGHTVITLSSLSSGDYPGIFELMGYLNKKYSRSGVSFQLPSLKIESFSLEIINLLSETKKSGLTFAIETPLDDWQHSINKIVTIEKIVEILKEASTFGYKLAKFYFMIGLPVSENSVSEQDAIISFINSILRASKLNLNITISTFVPKPHTPYQHVPQLSLSESTKKIYAIKDAFKYNKNIKISYHSPLMSQVEGLIARGDGRVGDLFLEAYRRGCRFDAWDDHFRKDIWMDLLEHSGIQFNGAVVLPWDNILVNADKSYLDTQYEKSRSQDLTSPCTQNCTETCGSCGPDASVEDYDTFKHELIASLSQNPLKPAEGPGNDTVLNKRIRLLFRFTKNETASFYAHHDIWRLLADSFLRIGLDVEYTQGFHPLMHMEISEPLPLGFSSSDEYGILYLNMEENQIADNLSDILENLNRNLPDSLRIEAIRTLPVTDGKKNKSLSSIYWGAEFKLDFKSSCVDLATFEKALRELQEKNAENLSAMKWKTENESLLLTLPFIGSKAFGLQGIVAGICGCPFRASGIIGSRTRQYAKYGAGSEMAATDYFSVLAE